VSVLRGFYPGLHDPYCNPHAETATGKFSSSGCISHKHATGIKAHSTPLHRNGFVQHYCASRQTETCRASEEASFYVGGSTITSVALKNSLFGFLASPRAYQHAPNNQLTLQFVKLLQLFFLSFTLPYFSPNCRIAVPVLQQDGRSRQKKEVNVSVRFCKCSSLDAKYNKVMTF
jgi:hypothetical protein